MENSMEAKVHLKETAAVTPISVVFLLAQMTFSALLQKNTQIIQLPHNLFFILQPISYTKPRLSHHTGGKVSLKTSERWDYQQ